MAQNDHGGKFYFNFKQELKDIGAEKPKLIAFGNVVHSILMNNLSDEFEIFSIRHYSHFMNKDSYRNEVLELCEHVITIDDVGRHVVWDSQVASYRFAVWRSNWTRNQTQALEAL